jgi:Fe-S-cluster-containing dehydrogenase component
MSTSRRKFLGWLTGAAGAGISLPKKSSGHEYFEGYPESYAVLHDTTLCIGCRSCEAACNKVNELPPPDKPFTDLSVLDKKRRTTDKAYTIVNKYYDENMSASPVFRKDQCNHCKEPACASACFVGAFKKTPEGAVVYDASVCVGCRYCLLACPFNIPTFEYNENLTPRVMKCTLCQPRIEKGLLPGCVEACPMEALVFGKREEVITIARERIRKYPERYIDHIYGEHEMGGTNWLYITKTPFEKVGMRTDLGLTPAPEFTSGALAMVPIVIGIWPILLGGIYAISKRKENMSQRDKTDAVAKTLEESKAEAAQKAAETAEKFKKEKEQAIEKAVKKALEEAAKEKDEDKGES